MAVKLTDAQIRLLGDRRGRTSEMLPMVASMIFSLRPGTTVDGAFGDALRIVETQSDIDRQLDHVEALRENVLRSKGYQP